MVSQISSIQRLWILREQRVEIEKVRQWIFVSYKDSYFFLQENFRSRSVIGNTSIPWIIFLCYLWLSLEIQRYRPISQTFAPLIYPTMNNGAVEGSSGTTFPLVQVKEMLLVLPLISLFQANMSNPWIGIASALVTAKGMAGKSSIPTSGKLLSANQWSVQRGVAPPNHACLARWADRRTRPQHYCTWAPLVSPL